jgi:tetratricopeptide (TPR) repeat protein
MLVVLAGLALGWWWRTPSTDQRLRKARAALAAGDASTAVETAADLEAGGQRDHARILRADLLLSAGHPLAAVQLLNQVEDRGDLRREAIALSGQCQLRMGNVPEAARAFEFVLSERPDHIDGHRGLAAVYFDQGALLKSLQQLEEVARLDPSDGRPHRLMGLIHADLDSAEEAVANFRDALRRSLTPGTAAKAHIELAEQLVKLGRHPEALDALGHGYATEPPLATAVRAEAEWSLGSSEKAAALLDGALARHPDALPLLRLRGQLHIKAGEWAQATPLLERATQADPADLVSLHQLALAYDRLDRPADAEQVRTRHERAKIDLLALTSLNREADAQPWDPAVRLKLAEVCDRLEKRDLAKMWRRSAAACQARPTSGY